MRKDIDKYEIIEKHLQGQLSNEDEEIFQFYLEHEPGFIEEVKKHEQLIKLLHNRSLVEIKDKLNEIHINKTNPKKKNNNSSFNGLISGIIIILLFGTFFLFKALNREQPAEKTIEHSNIINTPIEKEQQISSDTNTTKHIVANTNIPIKNIASDTSNQKQKKESEAVKEIIKDSSTTLNISQQRSKLTANSIQPIKATQPIPVKTIAPLQLAKKNTSKNTEKINCDNVVIDALVTTEASCDNKPTGKIIIDLESISGGTSPYEVSIDNEENYSNSFLFNKQFSKSYSVYIRDFNKCSTYLGSFLIDQEDCSYEYAFAPDEGEEWKIPTKTSSGSIKIFSKAGTLVYEEQLSSSIDYYWQGKSNVGNALPMGMYMFILNLDTEENLVGHVTIIR